MDRTYNPCDECPYGIDKRDGSGNDSMCKICEFTVLLNRRAAPESKPLTLEQLRQMDGEPVWLVTVLPEHHEKWVIFDILQYQRNFKDYGVTWLAYAHKPEQEEK